MPESPDRALSPATRAELLTHDVLYLPIRHHSPACARAIQQVLERARPWAVLVEGPPSFDDIIDLVVHPDAVMPLAVYAHVAVDNDALPGSAQRIGTYFPLCDYSPELVALRTGARLGARLHFIDLDYPDLARAGSIEDRRGLVDERHYAYSAALSRLATQLGCRDHNELWDHLIEAADLDADALVEAVAAYGRLARVGTDDDHLHVTRAREAAMAVGIRQALTERNSAGSNRPIAVVTGAFHTAVLPELVAAEAPTEPPTRRPPVRDNGHGLVRYSFDRLDALSGYAAGMPAPAWYQRVWGRATDPGPPEEPGAAPRDEAHETLVNVAAALRARNGDGQPSTPALVDAHGQARLLAQLRGRRRIARCDVIDAIVTCFTKGDLAPDVLDALEREMTGTRVGRLPPGTPRSPLSRDFDERAHHLGLKLDTTEARQVELDLYRSARHRDISRFLHGLTALGVAFAVARQQPRFSAAVGRDVLREIWICRFSAETDMTLTEAARWGASIPEAVAEHLRAEVDTAISGQAGSDRLLQLVLAAAQRGVHDAIDPILHEVRTRVASDPDLSSVTAALTEAQLLWSARAPLDGPALRALPPVGEQLYLRACRLFEDLPATPDELLNARVEDLRAVHQTLRSVEWLSLDPSLYWDTLLATRPHTAPRLRGAIDGLQWHDGRLSDDELERHVVGHLSTSGDPAVGATYLGGLIAVAREALWHHARLIDAISDHLADLDDAQFVRRVPALRSAFTALSPRETDQVAEKLTHARGIHASIRVPDQSETELLENLARSQQVAERLASDGLGAWLTPSTATDTDTGVDTGVES